MSQYLGTMIPTHPGSGDWSEQHNLAGWLILVLTIAYIFVRMLPWGPGETPQTTAGTCARIQPEQDCADELARKDAVNRLGDLWYPGARVTATGSLGAWVRLNSAAPAAQVARYYATLLGSPRKEAPGTWSFRKDTSKFSTAVIVAQSGPGESVVDVFWPTGEQAIPEVSGTLW